MISKRPFTDLDQNLNNESSPAQSGVSLFLLPIYSPEFENTKTELFCKFWLSTIISPIDFYCSNNYSSLNCPPNIIDKTPAIFSSAKEEKTVPRELLLFFLSQNWTVSFEACSAHSNFLMMNSKNNFQTMFHAHALSISFRIPCQTKFTLTVQEFLFKGSKVYHCT